MSNIVIATGANSPGGVLTQLEFDPQNYNSNNLAISDTGVGFNDKITFVPTTPTAVTVSAYAALRPEGIAQPVGTPFQIPSGQNIVIHAHVNIAGAGVAQYIYDCMYKILASDFTLDNILPTTLPNIGMQKTAANANQGNFLRIGGTTVYVDTRTNNPFIDNIGIAFAASGEIYFADFTGDSIVGTWRPSGITPPHFAPIVLGASLRSNTAASTLTLDNTPLSSYPTGDTWLQNACVIGA